MKKVLCIIVIIMFCSCNGITNLNHKPENKELCGTWELDKISYDLLRAYSYECNDIKITLYNDGSFEAINFPNTSNGFSTEIDKACETIGGKWNIEKRFTKEKWTVVLRFDESQIDGDRLLMEYDIFMEDNKLILRHAFESTEYNNLDSDDRFLFKKKIDLLPTHATSNLGNRLNLKMVLYLG